MGDIGKLNRRILFEELTTTDDGYGGEMESYVSKAIIWASRRQLSATKAVAFGIDLMTKAFQYEFRKDAFEPTRLNRIDDEGLKLNIVAIEDVGDGRFYTRVTAKEKE